MPALWVSSSLKQAVPALCKRQEDRGLEKKETKKEILYVPQKRQMHSNYSLSLIDTATIYIHWIKVFLSILHRVFLFTLQQFLKFKLGKILLLSKLLTLIFKYLFHWLCKREEIQTALQKFPCSKILVRDLLQVWHCTHIPTTCFHCT